MSKSQTFGFDKSMEHFLFRNEDKDQIYLEVYKTSYI